MQYSGQPSSSSQASTDLGGCGSAGSGFSSSQDASRHSPGEHSSSSLFYNSTSSTLLSVVGGAALGGVLMYLLDPEEGPSRRRYVGELAGEAWETARDTASGVGAATAAGATALASRVGRGAERARERVSESRLARRVSHGTRNLRNESSDRMRYLVRGNQRTAYIQTCTGEALAAIGCLALGVGAMYLLDPADGGRRRHVLRDKFMSGFGRMATKLERLGRDAWNRTAGTVHELKARRGEEFIDDRTLVERIRANVGHCVAINLRHLDLTATNGRVTLRGSIPEHEVDNVLKCAWSTRGVKEIINQINMGAAVGGTASSAAQVRPAPGSGPMGSTITCPDPT
jgi:hypothetical protein